jgi:ABC-type nitrate/sulfonate/bicarbonate transport system substrate-binding protein
MNKKSIFFAVVFSLFFLNFSGGSADAQASAPVTIRIAYPTGTLINGHIGQVLLKTDILKKHGFVAEVTGFQYGPPMMEALLGNKVDVAFTSEVPATLALGKGLPAKIIASFGSLGRGALMVTKDSSAKSILDLKGKKIGVPFGSSPHRNLLGMLKKTGLKPGKDVEVLNIGRDELAAVAVKKSVDAIVAWDPAAEQLCQKEGFRIIEAGEYYSVTVMSTAYLEKNKKHIAAFFAALQEAVYYMATHKAEADTWFAEVSRLDPGIIALCATFNENYRTVKKMSDVKISLTDTFIAVMQDSVAFTVEQKLLPTAFDIQSVLMKDSK